MSENKIKWQTTDRDKGISYFNLYPLFKAKIKFCQKVDLLIKSEIFDSNRSVWDLVGNSKSLKWIFCFEY